MNHGHVTPNKDGSLARCGGPGLCPECSQEKLLQQAKNDVDIWVNGLPIPIKEDPFKIIALKNHIEEITEERNRLEARLRIAKVALREIAERALKMINEEGETK